MEDEYSIYAPIRLRSFSYYNYARESAKNGAITVEGLVHQGLHEHLRQALIGPAIKSVIDLAARGEVPGDSAGALVVKYLSFIDWVPLLGQYEIAGRQIFDVRESLTELLRHTDLGDCTLEDLHLPYSCIYIHFGKLEDVRHIFDEEAGTYEYVDGAFVALSQADQDGNSRIKIGLSTVHEDGSGVMYPGLFFDINPDERKLPVLDGIDAALERRMAAHHPGKDANVTLQQLTEHVLAADEEAAEHLRTAASLLVNALFYLENIREHLPDRAPGRDTPPSLVTRWNNANPRQRVKQTSALTADAYAVVHLVGAEVDGHSQIVAAGTSKRVHWRRGHWRQQPYGEGRRFRRRQWIKPVLVGVGDATAEPPGHVYMAPGPDNTQ